jgi:uncharacterized membrane protein YgcG
MKRLIAVAVLVLICTRAAPAQEEGDIGMFYSSLGSQGEWISMEGGTYAWRPAGVDPGWRPYTDGHWVWTDDGWYWASDEPWAWATYHYGRWYYDDYYGWVWVPGYEWAPAWVEWRYGGDYIGWAPLGPYAVFSASWGIHYRRYWATPYYYWSFVDCRHMGAHDVHRYVYRTDENVRLIGRTRTAGSVRFENGRITSRGPEREFVEQRGNIRIPRIGLIDTRDRGRAGMVRSGGVERIEVYRPRIEASPRVTTTVRPDRVRVDDHPMNLDTRGTDIRRTEDAREPRGTMVPRSDIRRPDARIQPDMRGRQVMPDTRGRQVIPDTRGREAMPEKVAPRTFRPPDRTMRAPGRPVYQPRQPQPERRPQSWSPGNTSRGRTWSPPQRAYTSGGGGRPSGGGRTESSGGSRGGGGGGRGGRR